MTTRNSLIQGYQWEEGEVRKIVSKLIEKYKDIPHQEEFTYSGPDVGMWIENPQNLLESIHTRSCQELICLLASSPRIYHLQGKLHIEFKTSGKICRPYIRQKIGVVLHHRALKAPWE